MLIGHHSSARALSGGVTSKIDVAHTLQGHLQVNSSVGLKMGPNRNSRFPLRPQTRFILFSCDTQTHTLSLSRSQPPPIFPKPGITTCKICESTRISCTIVFNHDSTEYTTTTATTFLIRDIRYSDLTVRIINLNCWAQPAFTSPIRRPVSVCPGRKKAQCQKKDETTFSHGPVPRDVSL